MTCELCAIPNNPVCDRKCMPCVVAWLLDKRKDYIQGALRMVAKESGQEFAEAVRDLIIAKRRG